MTYRWRMTVYFVLLLACFIGAVSKVAPLFFSCLFLAIAISQFFFLCPRCGKHIDTKGADRGNFFYGVFEVHEDICPRCARSRDRVWPLQYVLKREKWDGVRKDEA